jgi:hypothetical protein
MNLYKSNLLIVYFRIAAVLGICAFGQLRAELPAEAQEAMDKGVSSAKKQEWLIAIQRFEAAREIAPNAPELFYNLGLAESKIPGRELRAIAWFGAYLAATQNAPNGEGVWHEIEELNGRSHRNTKHLLEAMQKAAENLPNSSDHGPHTDGYRRDYALNGIACVYAWYADLGTARKISKSIQNAELKDGVYVQIIVRQLRDDDIAAVRRTYAAIGSRSQQNIAKGYIDDFPQDRERRVALENKVISLDDWLGLFRQDTIRHMLSEPFFVDLAGTLRAKLGGKTASDIFAQYNYITNNVARMQQDIDRMLKQQAKPKNAQ